MILIKIWINGKYASATPVKILVDDSMCPCFGLTPKGAAARFMSLELADKSEHSESPCFEKDVKVCENYTFHNLCTNKTYSAIKRQVSCNNIYQ